MKIVAMTQMRVEIRRLGILVAHPERADTRRIEALVTVEPMEEMTVGSALLTVSATSGLTRSASSSSDLERFSSPG